MHTAPPAQARLALYASFADFDDAVAAGNTLIDLDPPPRNLSIDDAALVALIGPSVAMPPNRVSLRATIDTCAVRRATETVAAAGGIVEAVSAGAVSQLVSLSFNHVTLRAKRARPATCHLQVGGSALVENHRPARATLPDGLLHLDAYSLGGERGFGGLLLSRFVDEDTLRRGMDDLRALHVRVTDPHTWMLGGHSDLTPTRDAAARNDPLGLCNPGKLPPVTATARG
jgi:hypothetical protein